MIEEFKCNECGNTSFEWVDFTNKSVYECVQCKTKYYEEEELIEGGIVEKNGKRFFVI